MAMCQRGLGCLKGSTFCLWQPQRANTGKEATSEVDDSDSMILIGKVSYVGLFARDRHPAHRRNGYMLAVLGIELMVDNLLTSQAS